MIRNVFAERPDLRLTLDEGHAMWGLDASELEAVLTAFVDAEVLSRSSQGVYAIRQSDPDANAA
jgi:hypothetical protein